MLGQKIVFRGQSLISSLRVFSAKAAAAREVKFEDEWRSAKEFSEIPYMTKLGAMRGFLPGGKYHNLPLIDLYKTVKSEYGNIARFPGLFGREELLFVYEIEDAEKVFRFDPQFPFRRGLETLQYYRTKLRPDVYTEFGSLISEQGENWYKMRTLINPVMLKPKTVELYVPQVDDVAKDFVTMVGKLRDANNEVPATFNDFLNMWSLESITCISLNRRLGLLNDKHPDENGQKLIKLIREFFVMGYDFEVNPTIWRYYETKAFKKLLGVYEGLTNIIMHYVDQAIEDIKTQPHQEGREESILEKLVKINKNVAVVMCADAMLAGVDTTSSATVGILYCLAKNPEKQEKLREELKAILPNKGDELTKEKMRTMPYLRSVIKESIRLFPPTAGNIRRTGNDLVLAGYKVPKGTEVAMPLMLAHTDDNQFKQPDKFIPERWMKSNTDPQCPHAKDAHPFSYLPFGFGARMCPGKRFAYLEMEVLITRIIREFKIEWNHPDMKIKSVLVNIPDSDLKFKFTEV